MKQWQFLEVYCSPILLTERGPDEEARGLPGDASIQWARITEIGLEGWELVSAALNASSDVVMWFKRPAK